MFRLSSKLLKKRVVRLPKNSARCVVDQFDRQSFNLNDCGWPRNDISQLARAQSKSEYDSIMARLKELKPEFNIKDGTTIEDAVNMIKPRYAQSPNEIEQFIAYTNDGVMSKLHDAYSKSLEDSKPDVKSDFVTTSETPVADGK